MNAKVMKEWKMRIVLAACAVFFLLPGNVLADIDHGFSSRDCQVCHQGIPEANAADETFSGEELSSKCVNCHSSCDVWLRHENRHVDEKILDVSLPLSSGGKVNCTTCHTVHLDRLLDRREGFDDYLRMSNLKRELCLNCHRGGGIIRGSVTVKSPPENVVVYEDHVPLLGSTEDIGESHLLLTINDATFPLPVEDGVFHTRLRLKEGVNRMKISSDGFTLWKGEVFQSLSETAEKKHSRTYFNHQTESLGECMECHEGEQGEFSSAAGSTSDTCYGCHEQQNEKKFLHGPLAVGACLSCHDPHGGVGRAHLRDREVPLCLSCHGIDEVEKHGGWEMAVAEGSCSGCHDPHQSDSRFFTRTTKLEARQ